MFFQYTVSFKCLNWIMSKPAFSMKIQGKNCKFVAFQHSGFYIWKQFQEEFKRNFGTFFVFWKKSNFYNSPCIWQIRHLAYEFSWVKWWLHDYLVIKLVVKMILYRGVKNWILVGNFYQKCAFFTSLYYENIENNLQIKTGLIWLSKQNPVPFSSKTHCNFF